MIVQLALDVVGLIVDLLALALPTGTIPFGSSINGWATHLHGYIFFFSGLLPVADQLSVIRWVAVVFLPGWLGFLMVRWLVSHIPFLGIGK